MRLARLHYDTSVSAQPKNSGTKLHVFFELGDHLGSTNVVLDKNTSELVERSTFQAYGAADSDYRAERWQRFREDYRFTGKEEDIEVGLQYFGKRCYAPALNRWVSADPLAVHVPGQADLNLYGYVRGAVLKSIDPLGLDDVMIVVSNAPADSVDERGARFGQQWQRASIKTSVLNPKTGKLETTYESPKRHVVTISQNASREQVLDVLKDATQKAGKGGNILINYGHGGTNANEPGPLS